MRGEDKTHEKREGEGDGGEGREKRGNLRV